MNGNNTIYGNVNTFNGNGTVFNGNQNVNNFTYGPNHPPPQVNQTFYNQTGNNYNYGGNFQNTNHPGNQFRPPPFNNGGLQQPPGGMHQPPGGMHQPPGGMHQPPGGWHQPPGGWHQPPGGWNQPPGGGGPPPSPHGGLPQQTPVSRDNTNNPPSPTNSSRSTSQYSHSEHNVDIRTDAMGAQPIQAQSGSSERSFYSTHQERQPFSPNSPSPNSLDCSALPDRRPDISSPVARHDNVGSTSSRSSDLSSTYHSASSTPEGNQRTHQFSPPPGEFKTQHSYSKTTYPSSTTNSQSTSATDNRTVKRTQEFTPLRAERGCSTQNSYYSNTNESPTSLSSRSSQSSLSSTNFDREENTNTRKPGRYAELARSSQPQPSPPDEYAYLARSLQPQAPPPSSSNGSSRSESPFSDDVSSIGSQLQDYPQAPLSASQQHQFNQLPPHELHQDLNTINKDLGGLSLGSFHPISGYDGQQHRPQQIQPPMTNPATRAQYQEPRLPLRHPQEVLGSIPTDQRSSMQGAGCLQEARSESSIPRYDDQPLNNRQFTVNPRYPEPSQTRYNFSDTTSQSSQPEQATAKKGPQEVSELDY